jgi:hypothetical protein
MLEIVSQQTQQLEALRADVVIGLSQGQKWLLSRWLYDNHGWRIFEEITRLDEYYPTRSLAASLKLNRGVANDNFLRKHGGSKRSDFANRERRLWGPGPQRGSRSPDPPMWLTKT